MSNLKSLIKYFFNLLVKSSEILNLPQMGNEDGVVVLSLKEYNALSETNYLMSTETNRKRMLESIQQLENEEVIQYNLDENKS